MKRLSVYWLTIEPGAVHDNKVRLMEEHGFEVTFFKTLDSLTKELHNRRASIIVVGDEGPEVIVMRAISLLRHMPDIQGARLILSTSRQSPTVLRAAACEGFRDILPIQMADDEWLERFVFSTSGTPSDMNPLPKGAKTDVPITLAVPARIVWMSPKRLWIESRVFPPVGAQIAISGPLAQAMGQKVLQVSVEDLYQNNLIYRFSEAVVGTWHVEDPDNPRVVECLEALKDLDVGERYKVFLAIQSPALRAALLKYLDLPQFEVHTALQKRSMIDEPRYFSPDLLFIEERLCRGENMDRFRAMAANLPEHTIVVVLGADKDLGSFRAVTGKRPLFGLKRIPVNLEKVVLTEYIGPHYKRKSLADPDAAFIPYDHEFSLAEMNITATMKELGPQGAVMNVPYEIGKFGLVRIKLPLLKKLLGRQPYAKIGAIQKLANGDAFELACAFCDLTAEQRTTLQNALAAHGGHKIPDTFWETNGEPRTESLVEPLTATGTGHSTPLQQTRAAPTAHPRAKTLFWPLALIVLAFALAAVVWLLLGG